MKKYLFLIVILSLIINIFSMVGLVRPAFAAEPEFIKISAGKEHVVALESTGTVWMWGRGILTNISVPTKVDGITDVVDISAGFTYTTAIKKDGTVWEWGLSSDVQIPTQIQGLTGIIAISSGGDHSLAVKNDGTVWAWGDNTYGQLGDNTTLYRSNPIQVSNLTDVMSVTEGFGYSIALKKDGTVWAWGRNTYGELGDGTFIDKLVPVCTSGLSDIKAISASDTHVIALKNDGNVFAWGYNYNGILGDGTTSGTSTPVQVKNISNIVAVSSGNDHSVAVRNDGSVLVWGCNGFGQLGDGSYTDSSTPKLVNGLKDVTAISAGYEYTVVLKSDGSIWTWGSNGYGQLGIATTGNKVEPTEIKELTNVKNISGGYKHSVFIKNDGTLWGVGDNKSGQLGDSTLTRQLTPQKISTLSNLKAVTSGDYEYIALKDDGTVWQWGYPPSVAQQVYGLSNITQISAFEFHNAALKSDGTVWTWGSNGYGQLGNGTKDFSINPVKVNNLSDIVSVVVGAEHTLALKKDGSVWSWGCNDVGQLGDGTFISKSEPVQIKGLTGVTAITAGGQFSAALKNDGTVWIWGIDISGSSKLKSPAQIAGANNISAIDAGFMYLLLLKNDGTVWYHGVLSDELSGNCIQAGSISGVTSISAGFEHAFMIKSDGTIWAIGNGTDGQIGDGNALSTVPKEIDMQPPTWPSDSNISISDLTKNGVTLSWNVATDNNCVKSYSVYRTDITPATVVSSTYSKIGNIFSSEIQSLSPNTTYHFKVEAVDMSNNWSTTGPDITVTTKGDSTINPTTAVFDKNTQLQQNISVIITYNGNTLNKIKNGGNILIEGTDYILLDNVITLKKEYLSTLAPGIANISFDFDGGKSANLSITILESDTTPPVVNGVSEGATYTSEVTIYFNEGTATLDGSVFSNGDKVKSNGSHTLIVSDLAGNKTTIHFIMEIPTGSGDGGGSELVTDTTPPIVTGVSEGVTYSSEVTITFNEGTATLDGSVFNNGDKVKSNGSYTLIVTDLAGNKITIHFTMEIPTGSGELVTDTTPPIVTGVSEGATYSSAVTITFNEGTATLDGSVFSNGDKVKSNGSFTLIVTDLAGNKTTIHFTVKISTSRGGGGGGSGGGSFDMSKAYYDEAKDGFNVLNIINKNNTTKVEVPLDSIKKALTNFKQPTFKLDMTKGDSKLNTITTFIPSKALTQLHDKSVKDIEIKTNLASVFLPTDIFDVSDSENISVKIKQLDTAELNDKQKEVVENAPVLEFSIDVLDKGDFSVGVKTFNKLVKVTIPYTAASGIDTEKLTVFYVDEKGNLENKQGTYNPENKTISFTTEHFSNYFVKENDVDFVDLKGYDSYASYVKVMAAKGIIAGTGESNFSPEQNLSRAEFSKLLVSMLKLDKINLNMNYGTFKDVQADEWFYNYSNIAYTTGLIKGYSETEFAPNETITYQDMCAIIVRALKYIGRDVTIDSSKNLPYTNKEGIADYAKEPVAYLTSIGVISADSDGSFSANENVSRAEAAKIMYLLYNNLNK